MNATWLVPFFSYLEVLLCATAIIFLVRSKVARSYIYLIALLAVRLASDVVCFGVIHLHTINDQLCYRIYFYTYWGSYAVESVLALLVIYSIFKLSMAPLKGLQTLGMLIFRWVAAISLAVSLGVAIEPHLTRLEFIVALVTQLQRTSSILTLCLLLFVCFAIKPMGLSQRSRIFGVSLGLGVLATTDLVRAAWISHTSNMQSTFNVVNGIVMCITLCIWSAYFAYPEPKRRMILLPTTSPFLRWNQISLALGDEPGYVAVGGIAPDIFAPAELELMKRASEMTPAKTPAIMPANMPVKIDARPHLRSISA